MPARETYAAQRVVDEARRRVESTGLVLVRTTIHVHERRQSPGRCPCCGSATAEISESRDDIALLVDVDSGDRVLRTEADDVEAFDRLAATARVIDLPIRVSRAQLGVLLADAPLIFVSGGSRAGKSHVAAWWLARRLLLRGGRGRLFWILGPSVRTCWISLGKLLLGREGEPPVLPLDDAGLPALAVRWPDSEGTRPADGADRRNDPRPTTAQPAGRRADPRRVAAGCAPRGGDRDQAPRALR